jgi:transposase
MPSVNKASLHEEFETLKARFEDLCAKGKMGQESRALFQAMLMLFELLRAVFMEKRTPKNSRNSGLPPSQTGKDHTTPQPGAKSKGPEHDKTRSNNTRTVETVELSSVEACEHCGEDLRHILAQTHERRTRIDIVFEKVLSHVDAEIKRCPHCRKQTKGPSRRISPALCNTAPASRPTFSTWWSPRCSHSSGYSNRSRH